jgi:hypothetical protein
VAVYNFTTLTVEGGASCCRYVSCARWRTFTKLHDTFSPLPASVWQRIAISAFYLFLHG